jgi:two-component system cell cycle sensor histidine kinase/response regulator CckA
MSTTQNQQQSQTVMIVDDELPVLTIARRMVERLGYTVIAADRPETALALYRAHWQEIACVLLDLTMPQMDGVDLFLQMREINPQIRTLLCSGYSELATHNRYATLGLTTFLPKPYRMDELQRVLKETIEGSE